MFVVAADEDAAQTLPAQYLVGGSVVLVGVGVVEVLEVANLDDVGHFGTDQGAAGSFQPVEVAVDVAEQPDFAVALGVGGHALGWSLRSPASKVLVPLLRLLGPSPTFFTTSRFVWTFAITAANLAVRHLASSVFCVLNAEGGPCGHVLPEWGVFDDLVACLDASGSSELAVADGVLVCHSGLGDGVYSVWRGDDASGDPAALELQSLPLGDAEFTTVATFDVPGPLLVADPSYVGFADAGTAAVRWLPEGTYLVQAAYSELEFWGRRLAALCLVRPAA